MRRGSSSIIGPTERAVVRPALACGDISRGVSARVLNAESYGPCCLDFAREWLGSSFDLRRVEWAAKKLRQRAYTRVWESGLVSNYLDWLRERGHSREDARQIRYLVEVYYDVEPVYAILASLLHRHRPRAWDHFIDSINCLDADRQHGRLIHRFHKALAAWPDYAQLVREEVIGADAYPEAIRATLADIETLSGAIPLHKGTKEEKPRPKCTSICLSASASVITLTSMLRRGFIAAEIAARDRH
ncbi:MAG: hypothetical protein M1133_01415 [Armatimonadetes bacterium]|nr:hypothetical protein [Armatimonadota bacterium]